jgi:hypothetical protein
MRNDAQSRSGLTRNDGLLSSQLARRAIVAITLMMWLVAKSLAFDARDQKLVQPQGAPPDLQITQVKTLAAFKDRATTDVETRWIAQVPRLTIIEGFDLILEARYSDGSRSAARSDQLKASARSAILQLATHPRSNSSAILRDFKVTLRARFKIASSFTVAQQVKATQGDSVRSVAGSSSASQPEVFITSAKLAAQGCPSGQRCVDVKWTAVAPRNITINEFMVSVDVLRNDGTRNADTKTASGQDRQARLQAGPTGPEINLIKVSLLTSFFSLDSKTVVKEGSL